MPYIRYKGGRPPDPVRELVGYEDPTAPCFEGLRQLSAAARRHAESLYPAGADRANAMRHYNDTHPYPGLDHLGGVGFVDATTRPIDEEITAEQYQQARKEIEAENQRYRGEKAERLARQNDPHRRAESVHESWGWRTRIWVTSYTELEHHVPYPLGDRGVAYLRVRELHPSGLTAQLIDIYHDAGGGIEQAILEGTDWAEVLVDFLALSGYGAASIAGIVATSIPFSEIGKEYELATFGASVLNTPVPVRSDEFASRGLDLCGRLSLRHLRDGLSAPVPTAAFAAFWNALECQAEEEARTKNFKRFAKCECGAERTIGLDTKRGFEAMYAEAGIDPALFDRHRAKRGTIQHGAKLRTTSYMDEVLEDLSQVQIAAMVAVSTKVGIAPKTITYMSTNWPVTVFLCCPGDGGTINVRFNRMSVRASAGMLPQRLCGEAGRTIETGVSMPPKVDPLAFPPVRS
jgi:hypothetical protein